MVINLFVAFCCAMLMAMGLYIMFAGAKLEVNIHVDQKFDEEDRQLLEDLFNKDGDPKEGFDTEAALDEAVKAINSIMLDTEEDS